MNDIKELKFQVWRLDQYNKKLESTLFIRNEKIKCLQATCTRREEEILKLRGANND